MDYLLFAHIIGRLSKFATAARYDTRTSVRRDNGSEPLAALEYRKIRKFRPENRASTFSHTLIALVVTRSQVIQAGVSSWHYAFEYK